MKLPPGPGIGPNQHPIDGLSCRAKNSAKNGRKGHLQHPERKIVTEAHILAKSGRKLLHFFDKKPSRAGAF
jgi:hypothetical protein